MKKIWGTTFLIVCLSLAAGCSRSFETIRDIRELPQDHHYYVPQDMADREIVSADERDALQRDYNLSFFAPWHQELPTFESDDIRRFYGLYVEKAGAGVWKKRRTRSLLKALAANARLESYPNRSLRAITIRYADLRGLPTSRSFPLPTGQKRKGAPVPAFDRLQVSSIAPNTPLRIWHLSADGKWALIETGFALGWLRVRDVGLIDDSFVNTWENDAYVTLIKDKVALYDRRRFLFKSPLGSLFPTVGEAEDSLEILVAVPGRKGRAAIRKTRIDKSLAVHSPFSLNLSHLATLANELVNEPYGWGGKGERRDCSSMTRDLFAPFGLWLPRHSADQAMEGGYYIDLSGRTLKEKKEAIVTQGIPYLTLLWIRGHVMLYVGLHEGEPLVFHNFWSIRASNVQGRDVKRVVGRAAITTLHPGREFQAAGTDREDFLNAVEGMTFLLHPPALLETVAAQAVLPPLPAEKEKPGPTGGVFPDAGPLMDSALPD